MRAMEILQREHQWIACMAQCLEALIAQARADEQLRQECCELLHLYESFADGRHQAKEEDILFPALLAQADADDRHALGQLLDDHEAERRHMSAMRQNLFGAIQGQPLSVREFARAASQYIALHRSHMQREATLLFPMAQRLLAPEADARVAASFEHLEGGRGDPHGLAEQIRHLMQRLGLPVPSAA